LVSQHASLLAVVLWLTIPPLLLWVLWMALRPRPGAPSAPGAPAALGAGESLAGTDREWRAREAAREHRNR
jgi:hypothetical protein